MKPHELLTLTKLPLSIAIGLALCATALANDDFTKEDQRLLAAMDAGYAYAKKAVPLADQEFKALQSHVESSDPGHVIFWMYQPVMGALDETHHDTSLLRRYLHLNFHDENSRHITTYVGASQAGDELYRLSMLESVLLAEALGGSPQQATLVGLYIEGQKVTSELLPALDEWVLSRGPLNAGATATPQPSPTVSPSEK